MKTLLIISMLFAGSAKASGFGIGLNSELPYIYGTFIFVILLIVSTDQVLKYIYKKLKEREEKMNEQTTLEHFEE